VVPEPELPVVVAAAAAAEEPADSQLGLF
jgi:hypothetical protein